MKKTYTYINKKSVLLFILMVNLLTVKAQDDKVKFGAYSRALQQTNTLTSNDTLHADKTSTGHVLLDLGIHITPDKRTEIQAIVRLKSDLNGFYGSNASATLRQLYVKGIIGKFLNYQVGDLYLQMTPYTFFNNTSEGSVNEGTIFKDIRRDYTNYENFSNRGNAWWQQGAHTDFALAFNQSVIDTVKVEAFFLRNRPTIGALPSAFHAGGKLTISQGERLKYAFNYVNLFDIGSTAGSDQSVRNPVSSFELSYMLLNNENTSLKFLGETGMSNLVFANYNQPTQTGYFYDAGLQLYKKPSNLIMAANLTYVDPDFYSAAAQSKRVNYGLIPTAFPSYGNDPYNPVTRQVTIFDLVRDPGIYNAGIYRGLMAYNPIFGNAQPYGKATPNRTGGNVNIQYKDSAQKVIFDADAAYLTNIVGEGSTQLRKFLVLKAGLDFNFHKMLDWKKRLVLTTGYKYEGTHRGGQVVEQIDLKSNLADVGLEIETFKKLDLLVGFKTLFAKGNEFVTVRDNFNSIVNYTRLDNINVTQNMIAVGLKYRFSAATYFTVSNHFFDYQDKSTSANNYSLSQLMVFFNMNF